VVAELVPPDKLDSVFARQGAAEGDQ
jgi:hypothetical protein